MLTTTKNDTGLETEGCRCSPFQDLHEEGCHRWGCCGRLSDRHDHQPTCALYVEPLPDWDDTDMPSLAAHTVDLRQREALGGLASLWERSDGEPLLYAGKLSSIYGVPNSGKTWVALMIAKEATAQGVNVLWLDFEDKPETVIRRAEVLGYRDVLGPCFKYGLPSLMTDPIAVNEARSWLRSGKLGGLVIIDAAESAGCPSDGADVGPWFKSAVTPFRDNGAGVLVLDHIPKRREDRADGAIGSQHKLAKVDGVALLIAGKPWTARDGGKVTLTVQKDRHGQLPAPSGKKVAVIAGAWQDGAFAYSVDPPTSADMGIDIPTRIFEVLDGAPDGITGQRQLREMVKCGPNAITEPLREMVDTGDVVVDRVGKANRYRIART